MFMLSGFSINYSFLNRNSNFLILKSKELFDRLNSSLVDGWFNLLFQKIETKADKEPCHEMVGGCSP